jgi:formiminotetrahydrofolate cyclodeaminase
VGEAVLSAPDFLEKLSSSDPVPGGGSVAALQAAMGASLLAMVCALTIGRKKYAAVEAEVERIQHVASGLRDRAIVLAEEDVAAYGRVADVLSLPRSTDDEKATRRERMQEALKGAALPPLETMRVASQVLDLAGTLVSIGNTSAVSDVGTSALAARAAYHAARLNVVINLAAISDGQWVEQFQQAMDDVPPPEAIERSILQRAEAIIRGEGV